MDYGLGRLCHPWRFFDIWQIELVTGHQTMPRSKLNTLLVNGDIMLLGSSLVWTDTQPDIFTGEILRLT